MIRFILYIVLFLVLFSCKEKETDESKFNWYIHEVTVSAYNSVFWQTQGNPNITAWGDTLKSGIKVVAVSRDLLALGIEHNTMLTIESLPDTFYVKDKMNCRWRNRIDIYMGKNIRKAREWGRKKLFICYALPKDTLNINHTH